MLHSGASDQDDEALAFCGGEGAQINLAGGVQFHSAPHVLAHERLIIVYRRQATFSARLYSYQQSSTMIEVQDLIAER